jgi:hypothetical protein
VSHPGKAGGLPLFVYGRHFQEVVVFFKKEHLTVVNESSKREEYMTEKKKWDAERVHQEIYDARTKMFVVLKVLETGSVNLTEHPEWTILMKPLLKELMEYSESVRAMADQEPVTGEQS